MNRVTNPSAQRVIRLWAGFDLAITAILVLPVTATWFITVLYGIENLFVDVPLVPKFESTQLFFVCLSGVLGVTWALARLICPIIQLGVIDSIARIWVCGLILYSVFSLGAINAMLLFLISELAGSAHQLLIMFKAEKG